MAKVLCHVLTMHAHAYHNYAPCTCTSFTLHKCYTCHTHKHACMYTFISHHHCMYSAMHTFMSRISQRLDLHTRLRTLSVTHAHAVCIHINMRHSGTNNYACTHLHMYHLTCTRTHSYAHLNSANKVVSIQVC